MARRVIAPPEPGHCVKEFKVGNTRLRICDDCVVKTKEEVDRILKRCAEIAYPALLRAELERRKKEQEQEQ